MKKILFKNKENGVSIVIPATKSKIEEVLGPLTNEEYEAHVVKRSIPDGTPYRFLEDTDIPLDREFRDAWCDMTELSRIDIDCEKARDISLSSLRSKRNAMLDDLDKIFMKKLEQGADLAEIKTQKQNLRDITIPLKELSVAGKINDDLLLAEIKRLAEA
jgi:hypothetical protein